MPNPSINDPSIKQKGEAKMRRVPIKVEMTTEPLAKPDWIRIRLPRNSAVVTGLKETLRENRLVTVCEEASCPNLPECFSHGTATFMIMGDKCTRRCTFCDVGHGRPDPLDPEEPANLARTIAAMQLRYVVITSVDRDDLRDGGAGHFVACHEAVRASCPEITIESLVPDFRGRMEVALDELSKAPPDVFNHNIETVPRLYKQVRPGSDYAFSLQLLKQFKVRFPEILTKSGIMLGLGEELSEVESVLADLRHHDVNMVTIGQYLQPSRYHSPVMRYVPPAEFKQLAQLAKQLGFTHVASGPLVRSSYHADLQAKGVDVGE
ncbi:MAG: lipA [Gammaproteobacteria bacterium]|nr:lipA [Gammaproteobacteria bacterium]